MGWQSECGTHEGYLVGLVPDDLAGSFNGHAPMRLRELGTGADRDLQRTALRYVRVACACGWRSPLLFAPRGTEWLPCCVFAPEAFETACGALWQTHVSITGRVPDGGCHIYELLARGRGI